MTRPILVPADAQTILREYVTAAIAGRSEFAVGAKAATVTQRPPEGTGDVPHVQVRHDGTPEDAWVYQRAQLGIALWWPTGQPTAVKAAANLLTGLVNASTGTGGVLFRINTGLLLGEDPDTKLTVANLGILARVRTAQVA